jgi:hypothetical protein
MSEKRLYVKVNYPLAGNHWCLTEIEGAKGEIECFFDELTPGERLLFEVIEMTKEEADALPEFEGW